MKLIQKTDDISTVTLSSKELQLLKGALLLAHTIEAPHTLRIDDVNTQYSRLYDDVVRVTV